MGFIERLIVSMIVILVVSMIVILVVSMIVSLIVSLVESLIVCLLWPCLPVQVNASSGDIVIQQLLWGPVQMLNTTLTCMAVAGGAVATAPPVTLVAETAQQLLRGIQLLGQLQPSTITLARDMSVPADTWPKGLVVNRSMVLTGLPPPAPRVLLDLYQVRWGAGSAHLSTSATA